eukprot:scaffold3623_cov136-Skeletonema_menzelii.AAC.3
MLVASIEITITLSFSASIADPHEAVMQQIVVDRREEGPLCVLHSSQPVSSATNLIPLPKLLMLAGKRRHLAVQITDHPKALATDSSSDRVLQSEGDQGIRICFKVKLGRTTPTMIVVPMAIQLSSRLELAGLPGRDRRSF